MEELALHACMYKHVLYISLALQVIIQYIGLFFLRTDNQV